jgi:mannose-1-phosphate guanylyltransferase
MEGRKTDMRQRRSTATGEIPKRMVKPQALDARSGDLLCGVVLAGGEGRRLRPFIHLLRKDLLPKQYVNFIGSRSMLEHTVDRAEKLIPSERLFTVINQAHLSFPKVRQQLSKRRRGTVVAEPENKGKGLGLLLSLARLSRQCPNASVVVFPSDHFVLEEEKLMRHVHLAHLLVKQDPSRLVLLGIPPEQDDSGYSYILPEKILNRATGLFRVSGFAQKPDAKKARDLILSGALWNTAVMVFRTDTVLRMVREVAPAFYFAFQRIYAAIGTRAEEKIVREMYHQMNAVNFSRELIEPYLRSHPSNLLAMPVRGVLWSDWRTEIRVMEVLRRTGYATRLNWLSLASPEPSTVEIRAAP